MHLKQACHLQYPFGRRAPHLCLAINWERRRRQRWSLVAFSLRPYIFFDLWHWHWHYLRLGGRRRCACSDSRGAFIGKQRRWRKKEVSRKRRIGWSVSHKKDFTQNCSSNWKMESPNWVAIFCEWIRIRNSSTVYTLLALVTLHIENQDTNMHSAISAVELLALTLRFLATSENFRALQYQPRIPATLPSMKMTGSAPNDERDEEHIPPNTCTKTRVPYFSLFSLSLHVKF